MAFTGRYGDDSNDTYNSDVHLSVYGGDGDDSIVSFKLARGNELYGGSGGDYLSFDWSTSSSGNLFGGGGNDWLEGSNSGAPENLYGDTGNDIILGGDPNGLLGVDFIYGGGGQDALYGYGGDDFIYGGDGGDSSGNRTAGAALLGIVTTKFGGLYGGVCNDYLDGGQGNDVLDGGEGDDTLYDGTGSNEIYGGAGSDLILVMGIDDYAAGGTGDDQIYIIGGTGAYLSLQGGDGNDLIAAGNSAGYMNGDAAHDTIFGGFAADTIYGGDNEVATFDFIGGYYGNDLLYGGTGTDGFNLKFDVRVGEYDNIGDWNVGGNQDQIYVNLAYQSVTTWTQQVGYVDMTVFLGSATYHTFVFGAGVTVANVQLNTFFL